MEKEQPGPSHDDDPTLRKTDTRHPSKAEGSEETVDEALKNEEQNPQREG